MHVVDTRRGLRLRKIITNAEDWCQPRRHNSGEFCADHLITLPVAAASFRVAHDDGRDDTGQVISGDLTRERSRTMT